MKSGKTLTELATELERQATAKKDFVAPTSALKMEVIDADPTITSRVALALRVGDAGSFPVRPLAHAQLNDHLKIGKPYYDRMLNEAPELLADNVNTWLGRRNGERRMVRTLDGNARAFLSGGYRIMDSFDLAQEVLEEANAIGNGLKLVSSEVTESRMYMKFVYPAQSGDVGIGDIVQAGVAVGTSEVGLGRLFVDPFLFRLTCFNGAVSADNRLRKTHVGRQWDELENAYEIFKDETRKADDRALYLKVRDVFRSALSGEIFNRQLQAMAATKGDLFSPEASVEQGVTVLANRFQLTDGERGKVLHNLIHGGDLSRFGLVQAVTAVANDLDDYDRASDFERFGGQVITLPASDWKTIANAKAA